MKRILVLLAVVIISGALYGVYLYNKKPSDTREEKADLEISASDLVRAFSESEEAATREYVDKILIVTGSIKEIDNSANSLFLDGSDALVAITCSFYADEGNQIRKLRPGEVIQVKGKCTGKLIDIVMNNCTLNNSK